MRKGIMPDIDFLAAARTKVSVADYVTPEEQKRRDREAAEALRAKEPVKAEERVAPTDWRTLKQIGAASPTPVKEPPAPVVALPVETASQVIVEHNDKLMTAAQAEAEPADPVEVEAADPEEPVAVVQRPALAAVGLKPLAVTDDRPAPAFINGVYQAITKDGMCECGRPATHFGRCKPRRRLENERLGLPADAPRPYGPRKGTKKDAKANPAYQRRAIDPLRKARPDARPDEFDFYGALSADRPRALRFAIGLTKDRWKGEELVSELAIRVMEKKALFKPQEGKTAQGAFQAWCTTILKNLHFSRLRGKKGTLEEPLYVGEKGGLRQDLPSIEAVQELDLIERGEKAVIEENAISLLDRLRVAQPDSHDTLLKSASGMSYEDIATRDNIAVGTVKSRISRGRAAMMGWLKLNEQPVDEQAPVPWTFILRLLKAERREIDAAIASVEHVMAMEERAKAAKESSNA